MTLNPMLIRGCYAALAVLGSVAAGQAILFPRWPEAAPLPAVAITERLERSGVQAKPAAELPAKRDYDRASSAVLTWTLSGGEQLLIMGASGRDRGQFQAAYLANGQPQFTLKNRRLESIPMPTATGLSQGRWTRLTCVLPGAKGQPGFGVSHSDLETAVANQTVPRSDRVRQVLIGSGKSPSNCTLVALRAAPGQPVPPASLWASIVHNVSPVLIPGHPPAGDA